MNVGIFEDVIKDVESYVQDINDFGFEDVSLDEGLFKNIQIRPVDEFVLFLEKNIHRMKQF